MKSLVGYRGKLKYDMMKFFSLFSRPAYAWPPIRNQRYGKYEVISGLSEEAKV